MINTDYKIIQIIPAPVDLYAIYLDDDKKYKETVTCLALVEFEDRSREVVGMSGCDSIDTCDSASNFVEYYRKNNWTPFVETDGKS